MKIERIFLSILAMLPFKAIAFAAEARLTTLAGLDVNAQNNWNALLKDKALLFGPMEVVTTHENAFDRFLDKTGLHGNPLAKDEFNALIEKMIKNGRIKANEKMIISDIPSDY